MTPEAPSRLQLDRAAVTAELSRLLDLFIRSSGLELRYEFRKPEAGSDEVEHPELQVELSGPDQDLVLERNAELLHALEYIALRWLHLPPSMHDRVRLECADWRAMRVEELKLSAQVAAEQVRTSRQPFRFNPMPPRERRVIHLALADAPGVRTASEGAGDHRQVVIYPAK